MVPVQVKRCSILKEFTGEQQHQYFGISRDKTLHHIDTLYYSVFLNEPDDTAVGAQESLASFLQMLRDTKSYTRLHPGTVVEFGELESAAKSFSMYEFCVSMNECFDIFISSYLPNDQTPRIVVQLRSRYLVLEGVKKAVEQSFAYLKEFLSPYGLFPVCVRENRIDYAYHTNLIQSPYKFFSDDNLCLHLKSNLTKFAKYGTITDKGIELETLTLGRRTSNNVYFRGYNKCQEIIRMNYKSFFFERWYQHGLISAFDKYVYEVAYEKRSYRLGVLVGRIQWYLEYGHDEKIKEELQDLIDSCYVRSDNATQLEKKLHNVIPEPTLIFNIEYQTKRKFYTTCSEWLNLHTDISDEFVSQEELRPVAAKIAYSGRCDPLLRDLFVILSCAPEVLDYLTGFGNVVSFVEDRNMTTKQFLSYGKPYMSWWKRIRATPIEYAPPPVLDVYRAYDVHASFDKTRRNVQGQIARLAMLINNSIKDRSYVEDMADVLCCLNDNDVQPFTMNMQLLCNEDGELVENLKQYDPQQYSINRQRKARQLRGVLSRELKEEEERIKSKDEETTAGGSCGESEK